MKLINNYDLMEKVDRANGIIDLKKIMLKELKTFAMYYGAFSALDIVMYADHHINWLTNLMITSSAYTIKILLMLLLEIGFKDHNELRAYLQLFKLSLQLSDLNIMTSPDLLKESEVIKTDYKVKLNKNSLPIIEQNKYILIPTYDGFGDIKETSLLQEHNMGSKEYILSIGSPKKAYKLAHSFGM